VVDDVVVVHHDVESPDLVRTHAGLYDEDVVDNSWLLQDGVGMPADDHINAPCRVEHSRQLLVRIKTDVCEKDREVDVFVFVGVADLPHLVARFLQRDESANQSVHLQRLENSLGDDTDEHDVKPGNVDDDVRSHQALAVLGDVHIGVDDREVGHLLQEQQVR